MRGQQRLEDALHEALQLWGEVGGSALLSLDDAGCIAIHVAVDVWLLAVRQETPAPTQQPLLVSEDGCSCLQSAPLFTRRSLADPDTCTAILGTGNPPTLHQGARTPRL